MGRNDPRNNLKKKEKKKSAHDNGGQNISRDYLALSRNHGLP